MLQFLAEIQKEAKEKTPRKRITRRGSEVKGHWRTLRNGEVAWINPHDRVAATVIR